VERDPGRPEWRLELAYGHHNVARIALQRGDLESALGDYRVSRGHLAALSRGAPDDPGLMIDLADSHNRIGLIEHRRGRLDAALDSYLADRDLVARVLEGNPDDTRLRERLATTDTHLVSLLLMMGRTAAAAETARGSVEVRRELLAIDPDHAEWRRFLANELRWLGAAQLADGDVDAAAEALEEARRRLTDLEPDQARTAAVQRMTGVVERLLAEVHWVKGDAARAKRALARSLATLETALAAHPEDGAAANSLARTYLLRGDWLAATDAAAAMRAWRKAVESVGDLAGETDDPTVLASMALAHLKLGEVDRARPLVDRLVDGGYRSPDLIEACAEAPAGGCRAGA
ncbi:MAG: tetratricopeptide repeat protein, partial [Acidobacteriota bacterium]